MAKCLFCGLREADIEDMICSPCSHQLEETTRGVDKQYMLGLWHKGEQCWLRATTLCQEGWCSECFIYRLHHGK